jgi:signal transduction histidine kinase
MKTRWSPASALAMLLDDLEGELLGAAPEEVQAALRETGRARESAVGEMRSLLRDAETEGLGSCPIALPAAERDGIGTRRH